MINKKKCLLPPEYIIEVNNEDNEKFMIGVSCFQHKRKLEEKFSGLQREKHIPEGKLNFISIKPIYTNCIKGSKDDFDQVQLKRLDI